MLDLIANFLLFLSSLILLIDFNVKKILPPYNNLFRAIRILKEKERVMLRGMNIKEGELYIVDKTSFNLLKTFIINENAYWEGEVYEWSSVVGIGIAKTHVPVVGKTLGLITTVYTLHLNPQSTECTGTPITTYDNLLHRMSDRYESSIKNLSLILLTFGFLFQLVRAVIFLCY